MTGENNVAFPYLWGPDRGLTFQPRAMLTEPAMESVSQHKLNFGSSGLNVTVECPRELLHVAMMCF